MGDMDLFLRRVMDIKECKDMVMKILSENDAVSVTDKDKDKSEIVFGTPNLATAKPKSSTGKKPDVISMRTPNGESPDSTAPKKTTVYDMYSANSELLEGLGVPDSLWTKTEGRNKTATVSAWMRELEVSNVDELVDKFEKYREGDKDAESVDGE